MITSGMTPVTQDGLFAAISGWAEGLVARFTQDSVGTFGTFLTNAPAFGLSALVLAAVISVLLFTLQRSDQGGKVKA
jgi:hypothetical protein